MSPLRVNVHRVDGSFSRIRETGATLIEAAIYLAVVAVITAPIATLALSSTRATADANTFARVMERNRASLNRISEDITFAISSSVWIDVDGKWLGFYLPGNFDGSGASGGDYIYYGFTDTNDDWENGVDDDNNGLIDEKQLWRYDSSDGLWTPIASSLEWDTSGFEYSGSGIGVTLTSIGHSQTDGSIQQSSSTLIFHPRN